MVEKCKYCGNDLEGKHRCSVCKRISYKNLWEIIINDIKGYDYKGTYEKAKEEVKKDIKEIKAEEKIEEIKNNKDTIIKYVKIGLIILGALHIISAWIGILFGDYEKAMANYLGLMVDVLVFYLIFREDKIKKEKEELELKTKNTFSIPIIKKNK